MLKVYLLKGSLSDPRPSEALRNSSKSFNLHLLFSGESDLASLLVVFDVDNVETLSRPRSSSDVLDDFFLLGENVLHKLVFLLCGGCFNGGNWWCRRGVLLRFSDGVLGWTSKPKSSNPRAGLVGVLKKENPKPLGLEGVLKHGDDLPWLKSKSKSNEGEEGDCSTSNAIDGFICCW